MARGVGLCVPDMGVTVSGVPPVPFSSLSDSLPARSWDMPPSPALATPLVFPLQEHPFPLPSWSRQLDVTLQELSSWTPPQGSPPDSMSRLGSPHHSTEPSVAKMPPLQWAMLSVSPTAQPSGSNLEPWNPLSSTPGGPLGVRLLLSYHRVGRRHPTDRELWVQST